MMHDGVVSYIVRFISEKKSLEPSVYFILFKMFSLPSSLCGGIIITLARLFENYRCTLSTGKKPGGFIFSKMVFTKFSKK